MTWSNFIIYMITSFKVYADYIVHIISNFHIYRSKFWGKSYKLGRNCRTPRVFGVAFFTFKDPWSLVGPGCHQVSSGVVVRIVTHFSCHKIYFLTKKNVMLTNSVTYFLFSNFLVAIIVLFNVVWLFTISVFKLC